MGMANSKTGVIAEYGDRNIKNKQQVGAGYLRWLDIPNGLLYAAMHNLDVICGRALVNH